VNQTETITHTETLYAGRVVHLRLDTVTLPDGKESKREIISHSGAVCIVAVTPERNVLFARQFRLATGGTLLEIPAGKLEPEEDPAACAVRELEEETGYRTGKIVPLFAAFASPGYTTEKIYAFLATELTPSQTNFDEGENIELVTIPLSEIETLLHSGGLTDMKSIAALYSALPLLQLSFPQ